MENTFEQDVAESLKRLWARLNRKVKWLQPVDYGICKPYVDLLKNVAENPRAYCEPNKFIENTKSLSFFVHSNFGLYKLDAKAAQCVYDIMLCMHDYIFHMNRNLYKTSKPESCKYKSAQAAIDAMRLFKRDSIQMTGGMIWYSAQNLMRRLCNSVSVHNK